MTEISDFFHNLAINSTVPIFTALFLGIMSGLGPCTMATNIAAVAYISQRITDRRFALFSSLLYSLGRGVTYTLLGILIIGVGMEVPAIRNFLEDAGTYVLGPLLLIAGILMLVAHKISFGGGGRLAALGKKFAERGLWGSFIMGVIFALAFCPYSAVLFFAVLMPLALTVDAGVLLPPMFGIGSAFLVIFFGILLLVSVSAVSKWVTNLGKAEKVMRILMALIFIGVGIYYIVQAFA
ncbi:MAG: aromatic aminobenezylarsenical efflux permease ArsG family transporter [Dehalococcoidales bacterium]|nr:aromatic aminobenezylarsenical efflux permease ArsG family transporter [Dehalococcoidales bacterium]